MPEPAANGPAAERRDATSRDEELAFVPSGADNLLVVLTRPTGPSNGTAVVLVHGAGDNTSLQGNRLWVRTARRLAAGGFTVVRFDFHGSGDSSGVVERFSLDNLFTADLEAVCRWVEHRGVTRIAFVGTCLGARTALALTARDRAAAALAVILMPVRDYAKGEKYHAASFALVERTGTISLVRRAAHWHRVKRLADPRWRRLYLRALKVKIRALRRRGASESQPEVALSPVVRDEFTSLAARHVPVLVLNGADDMHHRDFEAAAAGPLAALVTGESPAIQVRTPAGHPVLDGFTSPAAQDAVVDLVGDWLTTVCREHDASSATG